MQERIRIGRRVVGFTCFRSEPWPWGKGECVPLYGPVEQLPERKPISTHSLPERIQEAVEGIKDG